MPRAPRPRGTTAPLDAVGRTIDDVGGRLVGAPEHERPAKVIVAILTDGLENASKDYTYEAVAERVRYQQTRYSWEFVFLAANQDAVLSSSKLAIAAQDAMSFETSALGTFKACDNLSMAVSARRKRPGCTAEASRV